MNNNRGNNRRRGRGNNRQQGNQPSNRIDSRARGNATQMLDKFKKMAHDAHLNDDRVTEEYYLQFADHYFRVNADQKQRQDESRQRRDERGPDNNDGERNQQANDSGDAPSQSNNRETSGNQSNNDSSDDGDSDQASHEPAENPFVQEGQSPRVSKPRRPRRSQADADDAAPAAEEKSGLDPALLPPSIAAKDEDNADNKPDEEMPKPRKRIRRASPPADDSGDSLEVIS